MTPRREPDPETEALAAVIGRRIRALRRERRLTQEALGTRIGLDRIYIGELERGQRTNPTLGNLRRIANGLGIPVRDLFPADDQPGTEAENRGTAP